MKYYTTPITEIVDLSLSGEFLDGTYDINSYNHIEEVVGGDDNSIEIPINANQTSLWDE